jgi:ADP-ribose pyrophosphatase YjhB (NUDIX family)
MKKGIDYIGVCVVFFCHDGEGNFLMAKRSKNCRDEHGCWDIGGGALELGDNVEKRLKDEIKEEYCTDIVDYEFLGFRDVHRESDGVKTHWIGIDFKVLVDKIQVKNGEPHKFDEISWFSLESLPEPLHSETPHFLEKYKEKLQTK